MSITKSITVRAEQGKRAIRKNTELDLTASDMITLLDRYSAGTLDTFELIATAFYIGVAQGAQLPGSTPGEPETEKRNWIHTVERMKKHYIA